MYKLETIRDITLVRGAAHDAHHAIDDSGCAHIPPAPANIYNLCVHTNEQ
jgi:hypothetical protein